jgi:hypothetical protein
VKKNNEGVRTVAQIRSLLSEIDAWGAEAERLRAALEEIKDSAGILSAKELREIATDALEGRYEP